MIPTCRAEWLTAAELAEMLGPDVTPELLRDWKRRGLVRGTVVDGVGHYRRDDTIEAEFSTRDRTKRRRAA